MKSVNVVLDTNIIVSAALSPGRNASDILLAAITGRFALYYDYRIAEEYYKVMHYPKFGFEEWEIDAILDPLLKHGIPIHAETIQGIQFTDESDRKFYEVAKTIGAILVTGNLKHYPADGTALSPSDFLALLASN